MLNLRARPSISKALAPIGGGLHRLGVSPNSITVIGTLGTVASAALLIGTGRFVLGVVAITVFVLFDLLDGAVARAGGTASTFGAVLDSTLDRVADASIFAAVIWWYAASGDTSSRPDLILAALLALVLGQLIPYVRARAEGVDIDASVGIAERAERLTLVLVGLGLAGLGVPVALPIALWVLVAAGTITVGQRLAAVHRGAARPRLLRRSRVLLMAEASLAERAASTGFALGWRAGRALDSRLARAGFDLAADLGWRRDGPSVQRLRANLRRVVGPELTESDLDALTRSGLRSYARYFREVFWLPTARPEVVAKRTRLGGANHVLDPLAQGRGVICALPHTGNWDAGAVAYLTDIGAPLATVAERLRPETLYQRFQSYRESLGMVVVPLTGGDRPPASVLAATLRSGGSVCLLCDRDLSSSGVPVSFFGDTITVPPGPALLAAQTGASLIPTIPGFEGDGWTLRFFPEVVVNGPDAPKRLRDRVTEAMQKVVDRFAIEISDAPQDWHMMQRLWREDLEPAASGRAAP